MNEYLPFILIVFVSLFTLVLIKQTKGAEAESAGSGEEYKYSMPVLAIRSALEQLMTEPIQCKGIELYWAPLEAIESQNGVMFLKYKIHFEYTTLPDSHDERHKQSSYLIFSATLKAETDGASTAQLSFEDKEKYIFAESPESKFLKNTTMSRVTQQLAQRSIEYKSKGNKES